MKHSLLLATIFVTASPVFGQASSAGDVQSLVEQARQQVKAGDSAAAKELLRKALLISPNSPSANLLLGDIFVQQQRYPEAMDRFETVLATDRNSTHARKGELDAATALALQAKRVGNQEAALACLLHARESLPDDPVLLRNLGVQLFELHSLELAAETLRRAIILDPSNPASIYSLARVETELQQFPSAEQHFDAYLKMHPEDATAHYGFGHLLQMEQRIDEAKAQFQLSISIQPQQTESYYELGQIALDQGKASEAKPLFQRTVSRAPAHGGALTGLGILAYQAKEYAQAAQWLKRATLASPEYQPAHYYLGLALGRQGDRDGSTRELKMALDLAGKQQGKGEPIQSRQLP